MNGREVSYVFLFFSVAINAVAEEQGEVSISGTTVSLICPLENENIKWYKDKTLIDDKGGKTMELNDYSEKNDGLYSCSSDLSGSAHYFYVKAKVCASCVDLNMIMAALLVFADVMVTLVIIVLVYLCARKSPGAPPPQRATQARPARSQGRGPPVPDPDYQMLNPATRSNDVYAQAQRK